MRVSFEWLKEFVNVTASLEEVAARLTMAGLEIEGTENVNGDTVFEVNVTPNRPDCLSMLGVAREVAAAFETPLKIPDTKISNEIPGSDVTVDILDQDLCMRYAGRVIKGVTVGESPTWIRDRLEKYGIRSLNSIVDITNYVLVELGHPLHAFDADKLHGGRIRVARAGRNRTILTLDGIERKLPDKALLIWDGREPVAIAGIMGGEDSAVTQETVNVFLESAYFEPTSVRRTSRLLGLRSESSYRFERGTDIEFLEKALDRAALLIIETGGGRIHEIADAYPVKFASPRIEVKYDRVNALLGTSIENSAIRGLLEKIGLKVQDRGDFFYVYPPAYRRDILEYFDVVEEVARLYNFGNIPVTIPRTIISGGKPNARDSNIAGIRDSVLKSGFSEVINYSFMNPSDLDLLSIPEADARRKTIEIRNPLRREDSLMRTMLVPSLLNNFLYNFSRGARDIRLFEISRVFIDSGGQLPVEELKLGGILYRENLPSLWMENAGSFYLAKGAVQALSEELKIGAVAFKPSSEVFLHPGKSADIFIKGAKAGFIGELGPEVVARLDLKISKPEIVVFEIALDLLLKAAPEKLVYSEIPKHPPIQRDVAIILQRDINSEEVMDRILEYKSQYLEKAEIFDCYMGKNIPKDKKSLGFRLTYRAVDRTLTDNEVEPVHERLVKHILEKTGGQLRA